MNGKEMLDFVRAAVDNAGTRDSVALLTEVRNASVRFGQNRVTQNMDVFRRQLRLTVGNGSASASMESQRIDRDSLPAIAEEARSLLRTAAADPEYLPPVPEGQVYPVIEGAWDEDTAQCPAPARMDAVGQAIDTAAENRCQTAGIGTMLTVKRAICTSTGNAAFHRETRAGFSLTMDRGRASSYSDLSSTGWSELPIESTINKLVSQVEMNENAVDLKPGNYSIILEPEATVNLFMFLPWIMNAREADQGTSVFSGMEGKPITGEKITLSSRLNGARKAVPFNDSAVPARKTVWIEKGILRNMPCDRWTALQTGRKPLFIPQSMDMEGGQGSVEDLVSGVKKGILIRRFWYIRFVDQKTMKLTGMTRDGVFLVENGRITRPVKDFRWNWRPFELFRDIVAMGTPERKFLGLVPPVVISPRTFPFTD